MSMNIVHHCGVSASAIGGQVAFAVLLVHCGKTRRKNMPVERPDVVALQRRVAVEVVVW